MQPVIVVHGGAGEIKDDAKAAKCVDGVKFAAIKGYEILIKGGSVIDAVEEAVKVMESNEIFNAGLGSVLNLEGEVEMDASIMVGSNLGSGAVTVVKDIEHPISLARLVMEKTSHVLLAGEGAVKFAKNEGVQILSPGSLVTDSTRLALEKVKKNIAACKSEMGTVGAVAVDAEGHVAAATSTGGREGKLVGRSSDTSMIGSGTYADDNFGAVSTTGHGETITKFCLAHAIIKNMEYTGKLAQDATTDCIDTMTKRLNNFAGAITISKDGDVGIGFSTNRMSWAYIKNSQIYYGIDHNEQNVCDYK